MVGRVKKIVKYDVTLTQEELSYLKGMLQNYHGNPSDEPDSEMQIRSDLFDGLDSIDEMRYRKTKADETGMGYAVDENIMLFSNETVQDEIDFNDGSDNDIVVEVMDDVKVVVSPTTIEEDEDGLYD